MALQRNPVLEPGDLNDADEQILDHLRAGRVTPALVADRTGLDRSYISQRLIRLKEHGHTIELVRGLYELVDDPRQDGDTDGE